jgi:alcohol dehydrogenase class IV
MEMAEERKGVQPFEFRTPSVVKVGWGAFATALPNLLAEVGIQRPLLVTDPVVSKLPIVVETVEALSSAVRFVATFDAIPGEPSFVEVEAGARMVKESGCDGLVAVGGGAVIDTAKAVSLLAANGGEISSYLGVDRFPHAGVPVVAVPTTAGTGSEVTRFVVLTDPATHAKLLITDRKLVPKAALIDPSLTAGAPARVTASSGLDALTHAIEAYVSRRANPMTDGLALSAIRRLAWALPRAYANPQDAAARSAASIAAMEAGLAFTNASVALVHGMSRPLGVVFGVPHGMANAMLLPVVSGYSLPAATTRYRDVAGALGIDVQGMSDEVAARKGLEAIEALCRGMGIPTLSEYGIARSELVRHAPRMAQDALASGSPNNNPRIPEPGEIVELYMSAY